MDTQEATDQVFEGCGLDLDGNMFYNWSSSGNLAYNASAYLSAVINVQYYSQTFTTIASDYNAANFLAIAATATSRID